MKDPSLNIKDLVEEAHSTAKGKGWWDKEVNVGEKLALIHSEVSEALEEYRVNDVKTVYIRDKDQKPEGFVYELADIVIRIADLCGKLDLNLEDALKTKMAFNKDRPYRHGNKKI
ncbi:hypothetical protein CMI37_06030 [Candidatus Pacearchaeota archaeon]|nr:hypothetical protein [Candidatus Pacearchaeota archaeon]